MGFSRKCPVLGKGAWPECESKMLPWMLLHCEVMRGSQASNEMDWHCLECHRARLMWEGRWKKAQWTAVGNGGLESEMSGFGEGSLARMRDQDAAMDVAALGGHERFPGKQWDGLALFGMSQRNRTFLTEAHCACFQ